MANPFDPAILPKILEKHVTSAKVLSAVEATLPRETQGGTRNYIAHLAPNDLNDTPKLYRALVKDLVDKNRLEDFTVELFNQGQGNSVLREILQRRMAVDDEGDVDDAA